ncbi:MAG: hypothetical protein M1400_00260 [Patescibacteria group bacterium]|nr:hypothetical protein [Patescibacteria group bacterium]
MLETKQQKQYFAVALVLVVVLAGVTFWNRPSFRYQEIKVANKNNPAVDQVAYLKYISSLQIDPAASKELFQQIITQDDIKKEVEADLKVDQPIVTPAVPDNDIKLSNKSGSQAVTDYLAATTGIAMNFNNKTKDESSQLFNGDPAVVSQTTAQFQKSYQELAQAQVPREAVPMHKALLTSFLAYGRLLDAAKNYDPTSAAGTWPQVYQQYAVINDQTKAYSDELGKLTAKYNLADTTISPYYVEKDNEGNKSFVFIKTAHAFLGIGDVTITIGDIPRIIMDAVKEGLVASFSQFMGSFLGKLVDKIESNYMVANFLYYSDALVSGQYMNDYLNKYVSDNLDRQIIKKLVPQFNCGKQDPNLKTVFEAQAGRYLGFDPTSVDPSDPNYYQKMAKVGDFLASPQGWSLHYGDLADTAKGEAEKSAEQELTSSGLKTPRDAVNHTIASSINSIVSGEKAAIQGLIQLGISNASSFISSFVAQLTQQLTTKFVFRGAVTGNGTVGVLKEQPTCLATAQMQVVLPAVGTQYQTPPPPPSQDQVLLEQEASVCVSQSDYSSTCLSKVNSYNSSQCTGGTQNTSLCSSIESYLSSAPLRNPAP